MHQTRTSGEQPSMQSTTPSSPMGPTILSLMIDDPLKKSGHAPTMSDSCIYKCKGERIAIIVLYVDDCTIFASKQLLEDAKAILAASATQPQDGLGSRGVLTMTFQSELFSTKSHLSWI